MSGLNRIAAPGGLPVSRTTAKAHCRITSTAEDTLVDTGGWLVGDAFSMADIALAPYVNRLAMLGMQPMWQNGRLPRVTAWFDRIQVRPTFKPAFVEWMPESLANDLIINGRKSWPEVAKILALA